VTYVGVVVLPRNTMAENFGHGWRNNPGGECFQNLKSCLASRFQTFHRNTSQVVAASGGAPMFMAEPSEGIACAT